MAMRPLMPGIAAGIGAGLAPLYRRKQFNPLGAAAGGVGAQSTLMQPPPESMLQTGAESQLERMRRGQFARPTGQMPSFGSRPNFGSFGMGQPATPQPDGTRLGDSYAAAMTPGYGRPRLPQTSPDLYGLAPDAPDLGPKDQYGFRRPLGEGNIAPYQATPAPGMLAGAAGRALGAGNALPGVLGAEPNTQNKIIGTLPEGAVVTDQDGKRIVTGPNVDTQQYDMSTKAGRAAAMRESNTRWFASPAGQRQLARIGAEAQQKRDLKSSLQDYKRQKRWGIPMDAYRRPRAGGTALPVNGASPVGVVGNMIPPAMVSPPEYAGNGYVPNVVWPNPEALQQPGAGLLDYWVPGKPKKKIIPHSFPEGAVRGPYPEAGW